MGMCGAEQKIRMITSRKVRQVGASGGASELTHAVWRFSFAARHNNGITGAVSGGKQTFERHIHSLS